MLQKILKNIASFIFILSFITFMITLPYDDNKLKQSIKSDIIHVIYDTNKLINNKTNVIYDVLCKDVPSWMHINISIEDNRITEKITEKHANININISNMPFNTIGYVAASDIQFNHQSQYCVEMATWPHDDVSYQQLIESQSAFIKKTLNQAVDILAGNAEITKNTEATQDLNQNNNIDKITQRNTENAEITENTEQTQDLNQNNNIDEMKEYINNFDINIVDEESIKEYIEEIKNDIRNEQISNNINNEESTQKIKTNDEQNNINNEQIKKQTEDNKE